MMVMPGRGGARRCGALLSLMVGLAAVVPPPAAGQVGPARDALRRGDMERALQGFRTELREARESRDRAREANALFYVGVVFQLANWQDSSEVYYRRALEVDPDLSAALNNLGQLYLLRGDSLQALDAWTRGGAMGERAVYAPEYGSLAMKWGDADRAIAYLERATIAEPHDVVVHEQLVALYVERRSDRIIPYAWRLFDAGLVNRSLETALIALEAGTETAADRDELMAMVAASLSQQGYAPGGLGESTIGPKLRELQSLGGDVGEAADELFRVLESAGTGSEYPWWRARGDAYRDPPRGVWPRDAFRSFVTSIGRQHESAGETERAIRYYRLAITLVPDDPDPTAFLRLVDLLAGLERFEDLAQLAEELTPGLFYAKGAAYRASRYREVYNYHRALSMLFGYLGRWGAEDEPASAVYQLQNALRIASLHNGQLPPPEHPIVVEPALVELFLRAYAETNRAMDGVVIAIDLAEQALAADQSGYALEILTTIANIDVVDLSLDLRRRTEALTRRAATARRR